MDGFGLGEYSFRGLIGLAVDAISGGLYKLKPDQITGAVQKANMSCLSQKDNIYVYVAVVLNPDPSWQKIGELQSANKN